MRIAVLMLMLALMVPAAGLAAEGQQGAPRTVPAPQAKGAQTDDETTIRASAEAFVAAFNKQDAKATAAFWTPDGEYADETGRVIRGREAIEKEYELFFCQAFGPENGEHHFGREDCPRKRGCRGRHFSRTERSGDALVERPLYRSASQGT